MVVVAVAGCGLLDDTEETTDDTSGGLSAVPALVADVAPSVVAVRVTADRGAGEGSGVIVRDEGMIVTNNHVVAGAQQIEVVLADGSREPAELVASDAFTDLALIRVDRTDLPVADFADEAPEVGQLAVSIGNPLGFENTVTAGVVSGLQRSIPAGAAPGGQALVDLVQTDAAISPGSSGGALVDDTGAVIGINVAYIPPQAGAVSLGFAIPSPTVQDVVEGLVTDGVAEHPYLGVQVADLTRQVVERFDLPVDRGVLAVEVQQGGHADRAGLEGGDVITAIGGDEVDRTGEFLTQLRGYDPGDEVEIEVWRDGEALTLTVTVGERPITDS